MFNLNHFIRWKTCFGSSYGENGVILENCTPMSLAKMSLSLLNSLSLTVTGRLANMFQSRHPDTAARCFYTCSHFNVSNCLRIFFFFIYITRLLIFCWNFIVYMRGAFYFSGSTVRTCLTPGTFFSTIGGEGDIHESTSSGGFHLPLTPLQ